MQTGVSSFRGMSLSFEKHILCPGYLFTFWEDHEIDINMELQYKQE